VEREIMAELHRELEAARRRLQDKYPESYVDQAFQEYAEGVE